MKKVFNHLLFLSTIFFSQEVLAEILPSPHSIKEIIAFTTQNSVKLEVTFEKIPAIAKFDVEILDNKSGQIVLNKNVSATSIEKAENKMIFSLKNLKVYEWTPLHPILYRIIFTASDSAGNTQKIQTRIGFRFFESKNGNLYLNGHPIFLRGIAINPPGRGIPYNIETSRKFAIEYVSFMKSIHVNIIRIRDDSTWYNVCDELGMMVFGGNYSSTVDGMKPPTDYDKAVKWYKNEKFASIASHPSLMIYAMTNETPYIGEISVRWKKFLTYAHKKLKKWDSTRVYIGNAGYGYGQSGDICDLHRYWGWYYSSPFTFLHIRNNKDIIPFREADDQPVTFTECVGNYTGPDGIYNLTPNHKNPGSQLNWTGHSPWKFQAYLADEHQKFTFQHATEYFRQLRNINHNLSGVFPFTILFHNWNTIKNFVDMAPKAITQQAKISYQPVLISWECFTPQAYTGTTIYPTIHIINDDDDFNDLTNSYLVYQLQDKITAILTTDTIQLPAVKYYDTYEKRISIKLPDILPFGKYKLIGKIMQGDSIISQNYYDILIAGKNYSRSGSSIQKKIWLYDSDGNTKKAFEKNNINAQIISSFDILKGEDNILVIGENAADNKIKNSSNHIRQFIRVGGIVVCLRQDSIHLSNVNTILSNKLKIVTMDLDTPVYPPPPRPSRNGYNINPERPDHLLFSGINRENLRYWSDYTDWNENKPGFPAIYPVTDGFILENKSSTAVTSILADYGPGLNSIALAEMFDEKGSIILCGFDLAHRAGIDPVADRLLKNIVTYAASSDVHEKYSLIDQPIIWGDYESEKGVITGINNGLLLNGKPRLTESYGKTPLVITTEGHEFAGRIGRVSFAQFPGLQYAPFGRRPFGPYHLRGFGNIPEPDEDNDNIGEGIFWCRIPTGKTSSSTIAWNPSDKNLKLTISVNNKKVTKEIKSGEKSVIICPVNSNYIEMSFSGDRRLVLLQTVFE